MRKVKNLIRYFSGAELLLWSASMGGIIGSFLLFGGSGCLTLAASLIGATSLIFNAKGNPVGQVLMIVFSLLYGMISLQCAYYGEMLTYMGMTAPMALFALISWLKNPFRGNRAEVKVNQLSGKEIGVMFALAAPVTLVFYFILDAFGTANMFFSTLSVTTSFIAVYLTFRRSAFFAMAYAANDMVLIVLWTLAARENTAYLSVVICFIAFLANDLYGFVSWRRMYQRQMQAQRS